MSARDTISIPADYTILFVAPFFNRSGFGMGARALVKQWHAYGLPIKILSVDGVEDGIDDFDLDLLKKLEKTEIQGKLIAIFYHVPNTAWLSLDLPPESMRIMLTTFVGALQGDVPPKDWLSVCNNMDFVFVNEFEIPNLCLAGLNKAKTGRLVIPHIWLNNDRIPEPLFSQRKAPFRFLTIAIFQPRRRWDTLISAFLEEFSDNDQVELYIKVTYPAWHPEPGRPRMDFHEIVNEARRKHLSRARIIIDEDPGTRIQICELIDSADCYVSTDTAPTAPMAESIIRGKKVIMPNSVSEMYPESCKILIKEDPENRKIVDKEIFLYQPHNNRATMPLLHVSDVRDALNLAFMDHEIQHRNPWKGWEEFIEEQNINSELWTKYFFNEINNAILHRSKDDRIQLCWEGSQFVYHSLAHVNRQFCLRLGSLEDIKIKIVPYEKNDFDPQIEMPNAISLLDYIYRPLDKTDITVRHQWPPNFNAPKEGAWVMIQPWEFGGIPLEWIKPIRELVDEIWVYTTWLRDCYVKSGIPSEKIHVVPLGVDSKNFSPEGLKYPFKTKKTFKYLFLGGTIDRKGIDIVIDAYLRGFSQDDDVCLIIKGQSGAVYNGSDLSLIIQRIKENYPEAPEIEYLTTALTEQEIASVYRSCDVLVHPYRGEGFGLPIAEAMSSGLPVIVTRNGAASDFTNESFAYLISSKKKSVELSGFSASAPGFWLEEPSIDEVVAAMRLAFHNRKEVALRGRLAREYATKNLSWENASNIAAERIKQISKVKPIRFMSKKIGFVYKTDWLSQDWLEVLISYISEFKIGEPVSLIFPISEKNKEDGFDTIKVINLVSTVLNQAGQEAVPDIVITDQLDEWLDLAETHDLQHVDRASGSTIGLDGLMGQRFAKARLIFVAANK